uniref:TPR_REGION domain-containing protein n=1 Tax=Globodera pallida TaxID=36090 RepID=A0A183C2X6_GLOPA
MSSKRDKNVVNLILNPTLPFGIEQREEANECKSDDEEKCSKLPNYRQSEALSLEGVNLAEKGNFENAMEKFDEAIKVRVFLKNLGLHLNKIGLSRKCVALQQQSPIVSVAFQNSRSSSRSRESFGIVWGKGPNRGPIVDFEQAAKLGSKFAKNQLIAMNPYAAMCNKMLSEMMSKFRREEH